MSTPRQGGASLVMYRIGGREYPLRTVAGCKVCSSPYRFDVEREIASGRTYAAIVRSLPEGADLSTTNLSNHYRGQHMPLDLASVRTLVERRAAQIGQSIEDGVDSLVDHVSLAQTVVQRAYEGIANGELRVDVNDGLAAAKLLQQLGAEDGETDQAAWVEAFMHYHDAAKKVMSPDQFRAFGELLARNTLLQSLRTRHAARDTIEGEVA